MRRPAPRSLTRQRLHRGLRNEGSIGQPRDEGAEAGVAAGVRQIRGRPCLRSGPQSWEDTSGSGRQAAPGVKTKVWMEET